MIDMHAHWRPAELIDSMRARTKEPRIVRNQGGVEVVKSRIGEEPVIEAVATKGFGVFESLKAAIRRMLLELRNG